MLPALHIQLIHDLGYMRNTGGQLFEVIASAHVIYFAFKREHAVLRIVADVLVLQAVRDDHRFEVFFYG